MIRVGHKLAEGSFKQRGRTQFGEKPEKARLIKLYEKENDSIRDIAHMLGCSKDTIYRCLREYRIRPRTNARRSSLRQYDMEFLETGIKEKGIRGLARELDIDESTLRHHMRVRKSS
jgi:transposase-like protein